MKKCLLTLFLTLSFACGTCYAQLADNESTGIVKYENKEYKVIKLPTEKGFSENLGVVHDLSKYGYINKGGQVVIKPVFEDASLFKDGEATVQYNSHFGRINKSAEFTLEPIYSYIGQMQEGFIPAKLPPFYAVFDINLKKLIQFEDASIYYVHNDYTIAKKNDKYGITNLNGEFIIQPVYDNIYPENADKYLRVKKDNKTGYIDFSGNIIIPLKYDSGFIDKKGNYIMSLNDDYVFIKASSLEPTLISRDDYDALYQDRFDTRKENFYYVKSSNDYAVYRRDQKWGIKTLSDNVPVTDPIFVRKPLIKGNFAYIDISEPMQYLDKCYKPVLTLDYDVYAVSGFKDGKAKVLLDDKKTIKIINTKGEYIEE